MISQPASDLSVVIVSYNTRQLLVASVRAIKTAIPDDIRAEIFVVDNASTDGSADAIAQEFPEVRLIRNAENKGFGAANNQAIALSQARYVLLVNSDATLVAGTVEAMLAFMDSETTVGICGGRLLNPDGSFQGSYFDFPTWKSELLLLTGLARRLYGPTYPSHTEAQSRKAKRVDWVSGALFMVRREAIQSVGVFDEHFFMYAEEMDWCCRMHAAGWEVAYVPDAVAVHIAAASAHAQPERRRSQVYVSKCLFVRKHWEPLQARAFVLLVRGISTAKLGVWWVRSLLGNGPQSAAAKHVTSYRLLLAALAGPV